MKKPYLILLLIAFFAITKQTKALITYTVVNKTAVLNQSVIIDVNKDGVDDIFIVESWDVPMDYIVTESAVYRR